MVDRSQQRPASQYVLCYALFAVIIVLSVYVIFFIWRPAIDLLVVRYIEKTWAYNAYRNFGYILMTLFGFVIVMVAEPYLRTGVVKNQLVKRFGKIALPLVIAGVAGLLLQVWAQMM
jgi:hypothetical protein